GTPVTLTVASLTSVTLPSGLIVTSGSSSESTVARRWARAASAASRSWTQSSTSRRPVTTPTYVPDSFATGVAEPDTHRYCPDLARIRPTNPPSGALISCPAYSALGWAAVADASSG